MVDDLIIKNLSVSYETGKDQKFVLQELNLSLAQGSISYVVGPNGGGKTTFLKAISREINFNGTISWGDSSNAKINSSDVALYPQDIDTITPFDVNVGEILKAVGIPKKKYNEVLEKMPFKSLLNEKKLFSRKLKDLSGGQRQLFLWAVSVGLRGKIILLDEAFTGLDYKVSAAIWNDLKNVVVQRKAISLIVTHDLNFILDNPFDVIVLKSGILCRIIKSNDLNKLDLISEIQES